MGPLHHLLTVLGPAYSAQGRHSSQVSTTRPGALVATYTLPLGYTIHEETSCRTSQPWLGIWGQLRCPATLPGSRLFPTPQKVGCMLKKRVFPLDQGSIAAQRVTHS